MLIDGYGSRQPSEDQKIKFDLNYNYNPQEKVELDLNNPIFVYYINISGISRQKSEEVISQIIAQFSYSNVTMWIVPTTTSPSKIECVYDGKYKSREKELSDLIKKINERIDLLSNCKNFEDFKINIRDWRINEVIDGIE